MSMDSARQSRLGISIKTSLVVGLLTSVLLAGMVFFFLRYESGLIRFVIEKNIETLENMIGDHETFQNKALSEGISVNAEIIGGVSADYLNNFNPEGLRQVLKAYMKLPEIQAIRVSDTGNGPFAALWRDPGVSTGEVIPDGRDLAGLMSLSVKSTFENEEVGVVDIYYTDRHLVDQINQSKAQALGSVSAVRESIGRRTGAALATQIIAVVLVVVTLIFAILISLKGMVITPLLKTADFAGKMSEGNFAIRMKSRHRDEIGFLGSALNTLGGTLGAMFKEIADGVNTLNNSSSALSEMSQTMQRGAESISVKSKNGAASTEDLKAHINSVSDISGQTQKTVSVVEAATSEMTATINAIADSSESARQITNEAVTQAGNVSTKMNSLGVAADEISKVTEAITEISEQTNLLALNATIEAARAGEAGRGFAVVAGEIKELARQTAEASKEIKERIDGVQESTAQTVQEINQVSVVINDVDQVVAKIANAVTDQTVTTREISENIVEMIQSVKEVNETIDNSSVLAGKVADEIADVSRHTGEIFDVSSKVNTSAEKLLSLSGVLKKMVEKFTV